MWYIITDTDIIDVDYEEVTETTEEEHQAVYNQYL